MLEQYTANDDFEIYSKVSVKLKMFDPIYEVIFKYLRSNINR